MPVTIIRITLCFTRTGSQNRLSRPALCAKLHPDCQAALALIRDAKWLPTCRTLLAGLHLLGKPEESVASAYVAHILSAVRVSLGISGAEAGGITLNDVALRSASRYLWGCHPVIIFCTPLADLSAFITSISDKSSAQAPKTGT